MLIDFLSAQRTWVYAKNSDDDLPIGVFADAVINPDSGKFEALWIKSPDGLKLILPQDVIRWSNGKLTINDERNLTDAGNLPRIRQIIEREIPILHAKVFAGEIFLGRVKNFSFDTLSPRLLQIEVSKGALWWRDQRIIPRNKILQITAKGIFISENQVTKFEPLVEGESNVVPKADHL